MLPAIQNGFTFIAFLMFVAGGLLALEKYAKWKIFNYMPPLGWIYLLNMVFCTMGLFNSDAVSSAYGSLKNNLLYAMIFVMLLRLPQACQALRPHDRHLPRLLRHARDRLHHRLPHFQEQPRRR